MEIKNFRGHCPALLRKSWAGTGPRVHEPATVSPGTAGSLPLRLFVLSMKQKERMEMNVREGTEDCSWTQGHFRMKKFRADQLGEGGSRVETSIIGAVWLGGCLVLL